MLLNHFFKVKDKEASSDTIRAVIELNASHPIYEGHFPGNPVTPGVVQLQMVKEIVEFERSRKLKMSKLLTSKFLQLLNPLETPQVELMVRLVEEGGTIQVQATGKSGDTTFFKMSAIYE